MARDSAAALVRLRLAFDGLPVLVVDDDPACRDALRCLLEGFGAIVLVAADGVEALAAIREHDPALVLSDLMMPRLDGHALARQLREDPARKNVAIIAISATISSVHHLRALRASGIDEALGKPFDCGDLDRAMLRLTSKRPGLFRRQRMRLRAHAMAERTRGRGLRATARRLYGRAAA
jgi:CheY-like chemotaxis protein